MNRDCTNDPEARAELAALGLKSLPVSARGESVVVGYDVDALREAFGAEGSGAEPLTAEKMRRYFGMAFDALRRAVRQIPQETLDWVSPGRPRTLRQLTWHSFERPDLVMRARASGEYTEEMVRAYETAADAYRSPEDICAYADEIEARLDAFLASGAGALSRKVSSYMGPITAHELMVLALGHAFQHLRQTYHYFGMLGIEPENPLRPEDYEEVPVPADLF